MYFSQFESTHDRKILFTYIENFMLLKALYSYVYLLYTFHEFFNNFGKLFM